MHSLAAGSRRYPCRSHPDPKWWQCAAELQNFGNWTCRRFRRRFRWLIKPGKKGVRSHCHARFAGNSDEGPGDRSNAPREVGSHRQSARFQCLVLFPGLEVEQVDEIIPVFQYRHD